MKKLISTLLSVALLLSCCIFASANDFKDSQSLELNNTYSYTLHEDDYCEVWYKFTPTETGFYDFTMTFSSTPKDEDAWINIYENYDEDEGCDDSGYYNAKTKSCILTYELNANHTYYLTGICFDEEITTYFKVTKHIHRWKTEVYSPACIGYSGAYYKYCEGCDEETDDYTIPAIKTVSLSSAKYTYDGKVKTPSVKITDNKGKVLVKDTNYTLTYASSRKAVGKYSVKVKFKGYYYDSKTLYFTIVPKSTTLKSVSAKKKGFTVKWKKQATQTTGYQVQYSTDKKFKKGNKSVTVKGTKNTSKTISKLKGKKKYYVRVRTYKTVNKKNYYSSWSNVKSVTTKK